MPDKFLDYKNFLNRELSWLEFEDRVLNEACDETNLLFERLKFLGITSSNLDEFFMIRVATMKHLLNEDNSLLDIAGYSPKKQLELISERAHILVDRQYQVYIKQKLNLLEEGIKIANCLEDLSKSGQKKARDFFKDFLLTMLTPIMVDSSRPFPRIKSRTINIFILLKTPYSSNEEVGIVSIPESLDRLMCVSEENHEFILLEDLIYDSLVGLYPDYEIVSKGIFRVTRNADFDILLDDREDILSAINKQVELRQWSNPVRLEVYKATDERKIVETLIKRLGMDEEDVYILKANPDLTFLNQLYNAPEYAHLKLGEYQPRKLLRGEESSDIFSIIKQGDVMLSHPFDSFDPVIELLESAASDPDVVAIKQTIYRVSRNSRIMNALIEAAKKGKQVTVLIELKARFDEANNIEWARRLESAGATVLYGTANVKTHCKITMVIRKENQSLKHYIHLGTGNYNEDTARLYTDISLMTCKEEIAKDAILVFNFLSGYTRPNNLSKLSVSPFNLKDNLLSLILREKENANKNIKAGIRAKMNSLCDPDIINALYEASNAGVKIELLVRGICCLRPGVAGLSDNISVISIVGNFLEHSRIFSFENGGNVEYYCSSSDMMPRNFERRIELMFPVEDETLKEKLNQVLTIKLSDNVKSYRLASDGKYVKNHPEDNKIIDSQNMLKEL